ncbi:MAG: sulfur carrier protein ThiS adenylyltransferase ThiF [Firmicutes bacterium]|nr:sulfur carrier protein ThiS adenylyltransferase ThiF [Bacillota bacterium]
MNDFEKALAEILGQANLRKIQQVRVGIAGAGGLGSNCALFLVRSGFRRFRLVDFDVVEYSNLNRQFYFAAQVGRRKVEALKENLLLINSNLVIEALPVKIEPANVKNLFADCDVVVEALDRPEYKKMVVETYLNAGPLLVAASGLAGWGRSDNIKVHQLKDKFYLIGDLVSEAGPTCPALAPGVNVAAAKQADVILNHFLVKDIIQEDDHDY